MRDTAVLLFAAALVAVAAPARAVLVTHVFGSPAPGQGWMGTLTYETDPPPGGLPVGLHLPPYDPAIGFDIVSPDPYDPDRGRVWESYDNLPFYVSVIDTDTRDVLSVTGAASGEPFSSSWGMILIDSTGTAFSGDGLPLSLSFDDFDSIGFYYTLYEGGHRNDVIGRIDWLYTVPEPDTALLLAAGLLILGRRSRTVTRRSKP